LINAVIKVYDVLFQYIACTGNFNPIITVTALDMKDK